MRSLHIRLNLGSVTDKWNGFPRDSESEGKEKLNGTLCQFLSYGEKKKTREEDKRTWKCEGLKEERVDSETGLFLFVESRRLEWDKMAGFYQQNPCLACTETCCHEGLNDLLKGGEADRRAASRALIN